MSDCPLCHREFTPTPKRRYAQVYCSDSCRNKAWMAKHGRQATNGTPTEAQAGQSVIVAQAGAGSVGDHVAIVTELRHRVEVLEHEIVTRTPTPRLAVKRPSSPATWKHGANCYRNHGCRCERVSDLELLAESITRDEVSTSAPLVETTLEVLEEEQ